MAERSKIEVSRRWRIVATWRVEQLRPDGIRWKTVADDYDTEDEAKRDAKRWLGPEFEEEP